MYLAIDPGASPGYCILNSQGDIYECGHGLPAVNRVWLGKIIELPMVYPNTPHPQANDLITLATRMGRAAERFDIGEDDFVWPVTWKGSLKKPVHHPRIFKALAPAERAYVAGVLDKLSKKAREDVMDAVGLAKWAWENRWKRMTATR